MDDILTLLAKSQPAAKPPDDYEDYINESALKYDVDPDLVKAVIGKESTWKPNAKSYKGASGLMQLMPATARRLGVKNIWDPKENIDAGTKYLSQHLDEFGDVPTALAAYNAGEGAVRKYKGIPPYKETRDYVNKITANYQGTGRSKGSIYDLLAKSQEAPESPESPNPIGNQGPQTQTQPAPSNTQEISPQIDGAHWIPPPPLGQPPPLAYPGMPIPQALATDKVISEQDFALQDEFKTWAETNNLPVDEDSANKFNEYKKQQAQTQFVNDNYKKYLQYQKKPDTPENRSQFQKLLDDNQQISLQQDVDAQQLVQSTAPQVNPKLYDVKKFQETVTPLSVAKTTDQVLAGSAGTVDIDVTKIPKGEDIGTYLDREALKKIAPEYGEFTDDQINAIAGKGRYIGDYNEENIREGIKNGTIKSLKVTVPYKTINDLLGGGQVSLTDNIDKDFAGINPKLRAIIQQRSLEAQQGQPVTQVPAGLDKGYSTEKKPDFLQTTPEQDEFDKSLAGRLAFANKATPGAQFITSLLGEGISSIGQFLAGQQTEAREDTSGLGTFQKFVLPLLGVPNKQITDTLDNLSNRIEKISDESTPDGAVYKIQAGFGKAVGSLPLYAATTTLSGGNPMLGMGLADYFRSRGRGENGVEAAAAGTKGAIFGGFLKLGDIFAEPLYNSVLRKLLPGFEEDLGKAQEAMRSARIQEAEKIADPALREKTIEQLKKAKPEAFEIGNTQMFGYVPTPAAKDAATRLLTAKLIREGVKYGTVSIGVAGTDLYEGKGLGDIAKDISTVALLGFLGDAKRLGKAEDLFGTVLSVPSVDPKTGVESKTEAPRQVLILPGDVNSTYGPEGRESFVKTDRATREGDAFSVFDVTGKVNPKEVKVSILPRPDTSASEVKGLLGTQKGRYYRQPPPDYKEGEIVSETNPANVKTGDIVDTPKGIGRVKSSKGNYWVVETNPKLDKKGNTVYQSVNQIRKNQVYPSKVANEVKSLEKPEETFPEKNYEDQWKLQPKAESHRVVAPYTHPDLGYEVTGNEPYFLSPEKAIKQIKKRPPPDDTSGGAAPPPAAIPVQKPIEELLAQVSQPEPRKVVPLRPVVPQVASKSQPNIQPKDIHALAKKQGIDVESEAFHKLSKDATGQEKLDKMTPKQLNIVAAGIKKGLFDKAKPSAKVTTQFNEGDNVVTAKGDFATVDHIDPDNPKYAFLEDEDGNISRHIISGLRQANPDLLKTLVDRAQTDPQIQKFTRNSVTGNSLIYHGAVNFQGNKFDQNETKDFGFHGGNLIQAQDRIGSFDEEGRRKYKPKSEIIPGVVSIKKPLELDDLGIWRPIEVAAAVHERYPEILDLADLQHLEKIQDVATPKQVEERLKRILEEKGYDGIVYPNKVEGHTQGEEARPSYIWFRSNQFKSIFNQNINEFNPDILKTIPSEVNNNFQKSLQSDIINTKDNMNSFDIYDDIKNEKGEIDHEKVSTLAQKVLSGEYKIQRLAPEGERGRVKAGPLAIEASLVISGSLGSSKGAVSRRTAEKALEAWAKARGVWVDEVYKIDGLRYLEQGVQSLVYFDEHNPTHIIKEAFIPPGFSNSTPNDLLQFIDDKLAIHNSLPLTAPYELVGITANDRYGKEGLSLVLRQKYIDGNETGGQTWPASQIPEFVKEMAKHGFILDHNGGDFVSSKITIGDISYHNVIKTPDGKFVIIDPIAQYTDYADYKNLQLERSQPEGSKNTEVLKVVPDRPTSKYDLTQKEFENRLAKKYAKKWDMSEQEYIDKVLHDPLFPTKQYTKKEKAARLKDYEEYLGPKKYTVKYQGKTKLDDPYLGAMLRYMSTTEHPTVEGFKKAAEGEQDKYGIYSGLKWGRNNQKSHERYMKRLGVEGDLPAEFAKNRGKNMTRRQEWEEIGNKHAKQLKDAEDYVNNFTEENFKDFKRTPFLERQKWVKEYKEKLEDGYNDDLIQLSEERGKKIEKDLKEGKEVTAEDLEDLSEDFWNNPSDDDDILNSSVLKAAVDKIKALGAKGTAAQWINRNEGNVKDWNYYLKQAKNFPHPGALELLSKYVENNFKESASPKVINQVADTNLNEYLQNLVNNNVEVENPEIQAAIWAYSANPEDARTKLEKFVRENRQDILNEWHEYLTKENRIYATDPFFKDFIWKDLIKLRKERPDLPMALDKAALAKVYDDIKNNPNASSFEKLYQKAVKEIMLKDAETADILKVPDGTWIKIPQTDSNDPKFAENVAKVQAVSNKAWCTSQGMAQAYLPMGDFWVLIKNNKSELAVRFSGGAVAEIQGQKNDGSIPEEFLPDVKDLVRAKNPDGTNKIELTISSMDQILRAIKESKFKSKLQGYALKVEALIQKHGITERQVRLDNGNFVRYAYPEYRYNDSALRDIPEYKETLDTHPEFYHDKTRDFYKELIREYEKHFDPDYKPKVQEKFSTPTFNWDKMGPAAQEAFKLKDKYTKHVLNLAEGYVTDDLHLHTYQDPEDLSKQELLDLKRKYKGKTLKDNLDILERQNDQESVKQIKEAYSEIFDNAIQNYIDRIDAKKEELNKELEDKSPEYKHLYDLAKDDISSYLNTLYDDYTPETLVEDASDIAQGYIEGDPHSQYYKIFQELSDSEANDIQSKIENLVKQFAKDKENKLNKELERELEPSDLYKNSLKEAKDVVDQALAYGEDEETAIAQGLENLDREFPTDSKYNLPDYPLGELTQSEIDQLKKDLLAHIAEIKTEKKAELDKELQISPEESFNKYVSDLEHKYGSVETQLAAGVVYELVHRNWSLEGIGGEFWPYSNSLKYGDLNEDWTKKHVEALNIHPSDSQIREAIDTEIAQYLGGTNLDDQIPTRVGLKTFSPAIIKRADKDALFKAVKAIILENYKRYKELWDNHSKEFNKELEEPRLTDEEIIKRDDDIQKRVRDTFGDKSANYFIQDVLEIIESSYLNEDLPRKITDEEIETAFEFIETHPGDYDLGLRIVGKSFIDDYRDKFDNLTFPPDIRKKLKEFIREAADLTYLENKQEYEDKKEELNKELLQVKKPNIHKRLLELEDSPLSDEFIKNLSIKKDRQGNYVVSPEVLELLRQAESLAIKRKADAGTAVMLRSDQIDTLLPYIKALKNSAPNDWTKKDITPLEKLYATLVNASKTKGIVIYADKNDLPHEARHFLRYKHSGFQEYIRDYYKDFPKLWRQQAMGIKKAYDAYFQRVYFNGRDIKSISANSRETLYEEIVNHLLDGVNIGLSEAEAAKFLNNDLAAYIEKNGPGIIRELEKWVNETEKQQIREFKKGQELSKTPKSPPSGRGKGSPESTPRNEPGAKPNAKESPDLGSSEDEQNLRERQYPHTVAKYTSLDPEDLHFNARYYTPLNQSGVEGEAYNWLREVGISDGYWAAFTQPVTAQGVARRQAVLSYLDGMVSDFTQSGDTGRAQAVYDQMIDLMNVISPEATEWGQAVAQFNKWSYLNPEKALQFISSRRRDKTISLKEQQRLRDLAKEIKNLDGGISEIQAIIRDANNIDLQKTYKAALELKPAALKALAKHFGSAEKANKEILKMANSPWKFIDQDERDKRKTKRDLRSALEIYSRDELEEKIKTLPIDRQNRINYQGMYKGFSSEQINNDYYGSLNHGADEFNYELENILFSLEFEGKDDNVTIRKIVKDVLSDAKRGPFNKSNPKLLERWKRAEGFLQDLLDDYPDLTELFSLRKRPKKSRDAYINYAFQSKDVSDQWFDDEVGQLTEESGKELVDKFEKKEAKKQLDQTNIIGGDEEKEGDRYWPEILKVIHPEDHKDIDTLDNYTKEALLNLGVTKYLEGKLAGGQNLRDFKSAVINDLEENHIDPTGAEEYLDSLYIHVRDRITRENRQKEIDRVAKKHNLSNEKARQKLAELKAIQAAKVKLEAQNLREAKGEKDKRNALDIAIDNEIQGTEFDREDIKLAKDKNAFYKKFAQDGLTPEEIAPIYMDAVQHLLDANDAIRQTRRDINIKKSVQQPGITREYTPEDEKYYESELKRKQQERNKKLREFNDAVRELTKHPESFGEKLGDWYLRMNRAGETGLTAAFTTTTHNIGSQRATKLLNMFETAFELMLAKAENKIGKDIFSKKEFDISDKAKLKDIFIQELKSSSFPAVRKGIKDWKRNQASIMEALSTILNHKQQVIGGILAYNPDLYTDMMGKFSYGDDRFSFIRDRSKSLWGNWKDYLNKGIDDTYHGKGERFVEKGVRSVEAIIHAATTLNRIQETHFRAATFLGSIAVDLKAQGIDPETVIQGGNIDVIDRKILERGVQRALEDTFAQDIPRGQRVVRSVSNAAKWIPFGLNPVLFRRFLWNSSKFLIEHTPFILAKMASKEGFAKRDMAKLMSGMVLFTLALQLLSHFQSDDDDPFTLKIGGKYFKVQAYNPIASFLVLAMAVRRIQQGKAPVKNIDEIWKFFGIDTRFPNQAAEWWKSLYQLVAGDEDQKWTKFGELSRQRAGASFGAYMHVLSTLKAIEAQFDPEEATVRDYYDEPFFGELKKNMPLSEKLNKMFTGMNTPKKEYAPTGETDMKENTLLDQLGVTLVPPRQIGPHYSPAEDYLDNALDEDRKKDLKFYKSPEQRRMTAITSQLYQALDKGVFTDSQKFMDRVNYYYQTQQISKTQANNLKKVIGPNGNILPVLERQANQATIPMLVHALDYAQNGDSEIIKKYLIEKARNQYANNSLSSDELKALQQVFPELKDTK